MMGFAGIDMGAPLAKVLTDLERVIEVIEAHGGAAQVKANLAAIRKAQGEALEVMAKATAAEGKLSEVKAVQEKVAGELRSEAAALIERTRALDAREAKLGERERRFKEQVDKLLAAA
jgi:hypothetical protein